MNILIPMAGAGSRFLNEGFEEPKPLIKVNGKTLIEHSVESLNLEGNYIFITRKYDNHKYNSQLSELIKSIKPSSAEIQLDELTAGAAQTCLAAKLLIDDNSPLVITNCDQRLEWDSEKFASFLKDSDNDGVIGTHENNSPKHSYALVDSNNYVTSIHEKKPVSNKALIGLHHWRRGSDFVKSADDLVRNFSQNGSVECYISETYNSLINNGLKIQAYDISPNEYIPLGTPFDLSVYQGKLKEFFTPKAKTIFCDVDGTILKHAHRFSDLRNNPKLLSGVLEKFNEWDSHGHKIILCTARKECARQMTESQLRDLGICWDQLIMGLTSGDRILINDKINSSCDDRAKSVNVITDSGFSSVQWEDFGI